MPASALTSVRVPKNRGEVGIAYLYEASFLSFPVTFLAFYPISNPSLTTDQPGKNFLSKNKMLTYIISSHMRGPSAAHGVGAAHRSGTY